MDTGKTQSHLMIALRNLPRDGDLKEVRHHLLQAMNKLEHVSQDRARKQRKKQTEQMQTNQWEYLPNYGMVHPQQAKYVIENIDRMIAMEKSKLENIVKSRQNQEEEQKQMSDYDIIVDWTQKHQE